MGLLGRGAGRTPHRFLRAPRGVRIPSRMGEKPHPWGRQNARERLVRGYAPRDHRPPRSRRALPALPATPPSARARRLGRGAALVGPRPRPQRRRASARADLAAAPEAGFDPLDVVLGLQAQRHAHESDAEPLSVAIPSHAITLQGSALFHTGDRQRVHAAVEGKLDDTLRGTVLLMTCERRDEDSQRLALALRPHRRRDRGRDAARAGAAAPPAHIRRRRTRCAARRLRPPHARVGRARRALRRPHRRGLRRGAGALRADAGDDRVAVRARPGGARGRDRRRQRAARDGGPALLGRGARRLRAPTPAGSRTRSSTTHRPRRRPP